MGQFSRGRSICLTKLEMFFTFLMTIATVRDPLKMHVALDEEVSRMSIRWNSAKIIFKTQKSDHGSLLKTFPQFFLVLKVQKG